MDSNIILKTDKLTRYFGALLACNEVSLEIPYGQIHAIIGPNGAGKTTYMDLIVNRTTPTSGKVYFEGKDITGKKPYHIVDLGICKCFQISKLFKNLTCFENVQIAAIKKKGRTYDFLPKSRNYLRSDVEEVLASVGIAHLINDTAAFLSYGDQRRLEIAITLAMKPRLLMLDEPTAGVARAEGYAIMDMVRKLAEEQGITVIFIEHDMDIVFNYADIISVMNQGSMIASDKPALIRQNEFVKVAYLGGVV